MAASRRRVGFTLVELLVVITIIGMLVALLLPAVQAVRENARTLECSTRMGELAKATINYETSIGNFPGYLQNIKRGTNVFATPGYNQQTRTIFVTATNSPNNVVPFSWATMLLSRIEQQGIWDQISSADTTIEPPINRQDIFICPSDDEAVAIQNRPALSFVANTGTWDRDDSGDFLGDEPSEANLGDVAANGVFFHHVLQPKIKTRLSGIRDGAATTLMYSENNHKTYDDGAGGAPLFCWAVSNTGSASGNASTKSTGAEQQFGMVWVVNPTPQPNSTPVLTAQEGINRDSTVPAVYPHNVPLYARPSSSRHRNGVNVAFCDGHTQFLRSDIDYTVYQRLMTPNGAKCEDPEESNAAIIDGFRRLPPLSSQDIQ